jgi:predicted nucleotidyltransferase
MITINNINQLSLPDIYKKTISSMILKLQEFPEVKDIILFGGCARQNVSQDSDIDLALIISKPISIEDEWLIDNSIRNWETNLPCDIIFISEEAFNQEIHGETIIRPILREGIRLNELLYQRVRTT